MTAADEYQGGTAMHPQNTQDQARYEWGILYPNGRIIDTADVDPTEQVEAGREMGIDLRVVRREIGPWREVTP